MKIFRYPNYDDLGRFRFGRIFWKTPRLRRKLIRHWMDRRHPGRERFLESRGLVELILASRLGDARLDRALRTQGTSLRAAIREIPPVFGSFWPAR